MPRTEDNERRMLTATGVVLAERFSQVLGGSRGPVSHFSVLGMFSGDDFLDLGKRLYFQNAANQWSGTT